MHHCIILSSGIKVPIRSKQKSSSFHLKHFKKEGRNGGLVKHISLLDREVSGALQRHRKHLPLRLKGELSSRAPAAGSDRNGTAAAENSVTSALSLSLPSYQDIPFNQIQFLQLSLNFRIRLLFPSFSFKTRSWKNLPRISSKLSFCLSPDSCPLVSDPVKYVHQREVESATVGIKGGGRHAMGSVGKEGRACIDRVSRRNLIPPRPWPSGKIPENSIAEFALRWGREGVLPVCFVRAWATRSPRDWYRKCIRPDNVDPGDRRGISSLYFSRYGGNAALIDGTVVLLE